MDWPESIEPVLTILPRGMKRDGGFIGTDEVVKINPARWTSRYGSLVTTVYGVGAADGINERGLAAHMLFFNLAGFRTFELSNSPAVVWANLNSMDLSPGAPVMLFDPNASPLASDITSAFQPGPPPF